MLRIGHPDTAAPRDEAGGGGGVRGRAERGGRSGTLLTGEEGAPNNYRVDLGQGGGSGEPALSPRHRQAIDQIRYLIDGDYSYGTGQVMTPGQVGYFPESVYFGPQLRGPDLQMLVIQFGGPSGIGYPSFAQRRKGYEALLAKGGTFEDGKHVWVDANGERHSKDGYEALTEEIIGRELVYPTPRYEGLIFMNPDHFEWREDPVARGVRRRSLGVFTERDLRIGFIRLDSGASTTIGSADAPEIMFLIRGRISHDKVVHHRLTAFGTVTGDAPETLTALEEAELLHVKLPTF